MIRVSAEAEIHCGRIILIANEQMGDRYKPAARDFDLCCRGLLLIISLSLYPGCELTRGICIAMNTFAEQITVN